MHINHSLLQKNNQTIQLVENRECRLAAWSVQIWRIDVITRKPSDKTSLRILGTFSVISVSQ